MLIDDQAMAEIIFDTAVNLGVSASIKIAQKIAGTTADGICGHNTLKALREVDPAAFTMQYALDRIRYYVDLCKKNTAMRKYLLGWLNRALYFV